jgi:hypothetical protein
VWGEGGGVTLGGGWEGHQRREGGGFDWRLLQALSLRVTSAQVQILMLY